MDILGHFDSVHSPHSLCNTASCSDREDLGEAMALLRASPLMSDTSVGTWPGMLPGHCVACIVTPAEGTAPAFMALTFSPA